MGLIIYTLLFLLAFISLMRNTLLFSYILILSVFFIKFLMLKIDPSWAGGSFIFVSLLVLLIIPFFLLSSKSSAVSKNLFRKLIISLLLVFIYLILNSIFKGLNPLIYLSFSKNLFYGYFIIFYFIIQPSDKRFFSLSRLFFIVFAIEVSFGLIQKLGPESISNYFTIISYHWNGGVTMLISDSIKSSKLVLGTMLKPTQYGNVITLLVLYFLGKYMFNDRLLFKKRYYLVFISFGIISVLFTGIRTSVVSLFVGILLLNYFKGKRNVILLGALSLIILMLTFQSLSQVSQLASSRQIGIENPIERVSGILDVAKNINKLDEKNALTLIRSIWLIPYIDKNPLFGAGLYWKSGYGLLSSGSSKASWTDATLVFFIVEFGLIGFLLFTYPYYLILSFIKRYLSRNNFKIILSVFIAMFVQTITDQGIFNIVSSFVFFLLISIELNNQERFSEVK